MKKLPCYGWIAVTPKSEKVWPNPWVYLRKTKPKEIELSGFVAVRVKITKVKR